MNLIGYSDSDWGGGVDDSRSTSGYFSCLGTNCFSWSSRKQETTTQSTTEAEYIAAASVVNKVIWLDEGLRPRTNTSYQDQVLQQFNSFNLKKSSVSWSN
ncbi:uncharacterized protein LOC114075967 [Solanum pennellii]|uniref:Uncharacterized protein LOC114075967 n=1 Tax=Solanum pennellii TaxID=28526 RepID=A0ABM1V2I2_SOLPN|nr:uncharacterized protein LOC114075967 [Solanum pennellii]